MIRTRALLAPFLLLALAGCASGSGAVAPMSSDAPPTRLESVNTVRSTIGGDWTQLEELPHSGCTPVGGDAETGMQTVVTTTSAAPRSAGDVDEAGDLLAEALTASGLTVDAGTAEGDERVVTAVDPYGATTTTTISREQASIHYTTNCDDTVE